MNPAEVIIDDFGNQRYASTKLEGIRQSLDFSFGNLVPEGAMVKTTVIPNPYLKYENGFIYYFCANSRIWEQTNRTNFKDEIEHYMKNGWFVKFVDSKEWNFQPI